MTFDATKPNLAQTYGDAILAAQTNESDLNTRIIAHLADTTPHGIPSLVASQTDYITHKANKVDAHGIDAILANITNILAEILAARGSKTLLTTRLDISLNADGSLRLSSLSSKWVNNSDVPTYLTSTTFTVPGDRTKVYIAGVQLRCTISGSYAYAPVLSVAYNGGTGLTTVTIDPAYPVLTGGLTVVEISLLAWDNSVSLAATQNATDITTLTGKVTALKIEQLTSYLNGKPTTAQVILRSIAQRAFSIPINCTNSQFKAGTAATASTVFTLSKNGVSFGTATFAIAGTVATFSAAGSTSFVAGDIFTITAPVGVDTTLADLVYNIQGVLP